MHGSDESVTSQMAEINKYPGINKVYIAKHDGLHNPYSKTLAIISRNLIQDQGHDKILAASNGFGKDLVPRIGGLIDVQAITDVMQIKDKGEKFVRPVYAGNALSTVSTSDKIKLLTIRNTNFEKVQQGDAGSHAQEELDVVEIMAVVKGKWLENIESKSEMADLTTAKYVVSGGRALKSAENFSMLHDIADTLGTGECAIGASRAAVDAGYVPNELQVGQTGKVVAPDIYFAIGISGAIQHVSGMKDSKVIVAINKDADAPIFKIANYGLVGDLFKILPELNEKLKQ